MISLMAGACLLTACFKDEPLNAECDVLEAAVSVDRPDEVFFQPSDSLIRVYSEQSAIQFVVRRSADLTRMAPRFKITEGATIEPASGTVHDFSQGPVVYTVTSEDRQWTRQYQVAFLPTTVTVTDTVCYDFEHTRIDDNYKKFYVWYEQDADGTVDDIWATGNGGYFIANQSKTADQYPTVPDDDGLDGRCLKLMTLDTGPLGRSTGRPIAAGNMFLGKFIIDRALRDALHATEMGIPFTHDPQKLTGYYRYQPGPEFKNKQQQVIENRRDSAVDEHTIGDYSVEVSGTKSFVSFFRS